MDEQGTGWGRAEARRLRLALYRQLGLASPLLLAACTTSEVADGETGGGVTTDPSGAETDDSQGTGGEDAGTTDPGTDDAGTSESSSTQGEDAGTSGDEGPRLDVGVLLDAGGPPCTENFFDPEMAEALHPECYEGLDLYYTEVCLPAPPGETSCEAWCGEGLCPGMDACIYGEILAMCGPYSDEQNDSCCVFLALEPLPPVGRPFVVDGELRLACISDRAERDAWAHYWIEMARGEHASIAAFARFVAQLQACAAPAVLVAEAVRAAADEVRHTQLAQQLIAAAGGAPLGLGALDTSGLRACRGERAGLVEALRSAVLEGCIGETLAAHEAACLAARAASPALAAAFETLAQDELRHAALAWRFVQWALARDPSLRVVVDRAFAEFDAEQARRDTTRSAEAGDSEPVLERAGPSPQLRRRWRATARASIVAPCRAAL